MLEVLTGTGLATAAGLNAYIPLLTVGLLARYTDLMSLPQSWQWLENPWVIGILAVLLVIEVVADKVPVVDHVNDVVQTVVRPTAGGLTFGAASSAETVTVDDPAAFFSDHTWVPVLAGIMLALVVHGAKAAIRPVVNGATMGVGAPVVSTVEDGASLSLSFIAILLPLLVLVVLAGFVALFWWFWQRRARRRSPQAADR
jgi:hypothetical protein